MYTVDQQKVPQTGEPLAQYICRMRKDAKLSQQQLADLAGIHLQSLGKLERGKTHRINQKTLAGLATALSIPIEYLDAVCFGKPVSLVETKKFCPDCWTPDSEPDPTWTLHRANYCLICGSSLRSTCSKCSQPLASFTHKFCPLCGSPYKQLTLTKRQ